MAAGLRHQLWRATHRNIGDATGAGRPFTVLLVKQTPELLLHTALFAVRTCEGLRPGLEIEVVWSVALLDEEISGQYFLFGARRIRPEVRTDPHLRRNAMGLVLCAASGAGIQTRV